VVVFCVRERESNVLRKNCIFFTLFYITKVAPSESVPLSKEREARNSSNICIQENLQKYTRRLALTRTRLKNFYILSSEEEEERERERYVSFARAFFSFKTRSRVSSSIHLSRPKNRNVARLPSISYQKSPSTYAGDATTQERIDKYAHI
jgi:hypothetical protein